MDHSTPTLCKANNTDATIKVFRRMQQGACRPNVVVYTAIIDMLYKDMYDACKLCMEMTRKGIVLDMFTFNSLINCLCKLRQLDTT